MRRVWPCVSQQHGESRISVLPDEINGSIREGFSQIPMDRFVFAVEAEFFDLSRRGDFDVDPFFKAVAWPDVAPVRPFSDVPLSNEEGAIPGPSKCERPGFDGLG